MRHANGHDWGYGLVRCKKCGVYLDDYERGLPYQCGSQPARDTQEPGGWFEVLKVEEGCLPLPATTEPQDTLATITIPARTLGPNDVLRMKGAATWENGKIGLVDVSFRCDVCAGEFTVGEIFVHRHEGRCKPATPEPPYWRHVDPMPDGLFTPDPIAEFNERRKAKREGVPDDVWQRFDAYQKEDRRQLDLARAMSTPLPHDPDMHTRLMPWRGK